MLPPVTLSRPAVPMRQVAFSGRFFNRDKDKPQLPPDQQARSTENPKMTSLKRSLVVDVIDAIPVVGDIISWRRTSKLVKYARKQGVDESYVRKMKSVRLVDLGLSVLALTTGVGKAVDVMFPSNSINQFILDSGLEDRDNRRNYRELPPWQQQAPRNVQTPAERPYIYDPSDQWNPANKG